MGQDYVTRKAAKKQRKRMGRDAESRRKSKKRKTGEGLDIAAEDDGLQLSAEAQKRKRKKGNNVSLRISRSLCYKAPELTTEDKVWDGSWQDGSEGDEGTKLPNMMAGLKESGYDSDVEEQLSKLPAAQQTQITKPREQQHQQKQQQQQKQEKQKPKLSTGISLLDPVTAAQASQQRTSQQPGRQQQQQLDNNITANSALQAVSNEVSPLIARCMAKLGFYEPTPIQKAAWPAAAAGHDVRGLAEPGSGKTLAYLLPALARLAAVGDGSSSSSSSGGSGVVQPRVLVLAPTRELAQQIYNNCKSLFPVTAASSSCIFGGVDKQEQIQKLQQLQPVVLVATPGRLLDLVDCNIVGFDKITSVVLDEADKMLSVGFEPQLMRLKTLLLDSRGANSKQQQQQQQEEVEVGASSSSNRPQILLFSATFPAAVQATAEAWLKPDAAHVECGASADAISRSITQVVHVCADPKKPAKLLKHLSAIREASSGLRNTPRVLIFANKIKTVSFIHHTLTEAGYRAVMLHGKRSQVERTAAITDFKSGKAQIAIASDVASRGLDIRGLPYVVNYDFPSNLETYIHRVGRTGRLAAQGHAYSFFTRLMARLAGPVVDLLQHHDQAIDPNLLQLAEAWKQVETALAAQGKTVVANVAAAAAAADGDSEEQEGLHDAVHAAEDLLEGLPVQQQQQQQQQQPEDLSGLKRKLQKKQRPGDMLMVPQGAAAAAAAEAISSKDAVTIPTEAAAVTDFMPSQRFMGAKAGMVFQKGSRGQGYYPDTAAAGDKQRQQQIQRLALQQVQKQQKAAAKKEQKQQHQQKATPEQQQQKSKAAAALPLLPGLARKQQKQQQQLLDCNLSEDDGAGVIEKASADVSGDDSGDEHQGGSLTNRMQQKSAGKRKALPGRLRKKLAKQKVKQSAS